MFKAGTEPVTISSSEPNLNPVDLVGFPELAASNAVNQLIRYQDSGGRGWIALGLK